ncbi:MAG TPA: ATP-binding protein [Caulobacteraceae bacterium]|jgi:PAS domain S-box-containing protein
MANSRPFLDRVLDDGLDELALSANAGFPARVAVNVAVVFVFAMILPWRLAVAWGCLTVALEIQAWFATRRQALGLPVGWRTRLWHICSLAVSSIAWIAIGAAAWMSGTQEGALCALTVWLAVIFFAQTNAYQSPLGFVVGGVLPGTAVLAIVLTSASHVHFQLIPVAACLALAFTFAGNGAARMREARKTLNDTQDQVTRSEQLYRVLADNVRDVIALTGVDGERIYISPSIEDALGYSPEHLYSTPNYTYLHPDDRPVLATAVAEMTAHGGELTTEYRVIRANGQVIWVETTFTLAPSTTLAGQPQIVSVSRQIDARKQMEAELIEARTAAEAAAAAKADFLANMTHELRTPLNAIIGFAGVLKDSPTLTEGDAHHVRLIGQASGALLDLVNDVLDFSRMEAGAVELDPAPFDAAAEVRGMVELMSEQARAKGLGLTLEAEETGFVNGDARRLRQVLLNFLSNAIKFTAKGAVTVRVKAGPVEGGARRLRVEVADSGVGLSQAQIAGLFQRFAQADASISRQFGGTGLGLAICKRIVEMMGGEVGVDSLEGVGSNFWLEAPLPVAEAAIAPECDAEAPRLGQPVRLLLVEDVAVNRELVKTVLAAFDIEIDTAEDGVAAIDAFQRRPYDLVLMDVQMPVMDGLTAARRIRDLPLAAAQTTPIVAMTANVLPEQIAKCVEAGMDGHLGKPMEPAKLLAAIAHWSQTERTPDAAALDRAV